MRLPEEPDIPPQINIVPMIDVIFALLTFFILSALYLNRSAGLPVNLPKAATAQTQTQNNEIVVTIDQQGKLFLNRQPTSIDQLQAQVKSLVGNNSQPVVTVNADERVTHGQVIRVMDQLRQIPGVRLAIAAQQPEGK